VSIPVRAIMRLNPKRTDRSGRPQYKCFNCGYEWRQRLQRRVRPIFCPLCGNKEGCKPPDRWSRARQERLRP